ncbi:MAG: ATP-binding protein [Dongiaceae bacterium]
MARSPEQTVGAATQTPLSHPLLKRFQITVSALPFGLFILGCAIDYFATRDLIDGRIVATTSLLTSYVETVLARAQTGASVLAAFLAQDDNNGDPAESLAANRIANDLTSDSDGISSLIVFDTNGIIVLSSAPRGADWNWKLLDDMVAAHRDIATSPAPVIGAPFLRDNQRQFNLSMAVYNPDGTVRYVVAAVIEADSLLEKLVDASSYRDFTISLVDRNGRFLARHPTLGTDLTPMDSERRLQIAGVEPNIEASAFVGRLQFSPNLRILSVQQTVDFKVYVTYSVPYWEALGPWLHRSLIVGVVSLMASILLLIFIRQLLATTRRRLHAERSLRRSLVRERRAENLAIRGQEREIVVQMAGGIGHEFNNLMAAVIGHGERLSEVSPTSDERERLAQSLIRTAERGGMLAHALLIYAGRGFLDFRSVDLVDVVSSVVEAFRTTIGSGVQIDLRVPDVALHTRADPEKLAIALGNLLQNAVQALPDGKGGIEVQVTLDENPPHDIRNPAALRYAAISVTDDGIGMEKDTLDRARDPFFTTRDVGQGVGLGLSIVHGLVQSSAGQLRIESTPNAGTRVTIWLPLEER